MYEAYQVRPNDTIESIARALGVAANVISEINGLAPNYRLTPGEVIVIPSAGQQAFSTYMVKAGDNMYNIAKSFNVPLDTLLQINGLNPNDYIYPNQELLVPKGDANVYTTKQGDTLDDVAEFLKTNKQMTVEENDQIYLMPGQTFSMRSH
jgi:LysM repeat protein